jgi:TonB-linked SusC/RagA family outer membrane protein
MLCRMRTMIAFITLSLSFFICSGSLRAQSVLDKKISVSFSKEEMRTVMDIIQKQANIKFMYSPSEIDLKQSVSFEGRDVRLQEFFEKVFVPLNIGYSVVNEKILLFPLNKQADHSTEFLTNHLPDQRIRGIVKNTEGQPLAGASVSLIRKGEGTLNGVITNEAGEFSVEAKPGDWLVISFSGFASQEIKVMAGEVNYEIILQATQNEIETVVVTALGIKKAARALTYNVQELKSEEITRNKDANFVNALSGKIAGVTINPSSSGIGGATRVVMRGTKSIAGNNNVLYVVDGIPIPNTNGGTGSTGPFAGVVSGEGISSINPEDIETISALTGPSATALYGNQGANGVIVITTRKGVPGKMKVNISHSSDLFSPFVMPQFQNVYGQTDPLQMQSWGSKLATPSSYKPVDFFQTGSNLFNSISLSGGTEKSQTFFSAGTNNAKGIIPNNSYNRYNAYLRQTTDFSDRLTADFNAMYVKSDNKNMIAQGQYHNPLVGIYLFPPGDDIRKYQVYERYDPDRKIPVQFWPYGNQGLAIENPYWVTNAESNTDKVDRYILSVAAKYKVLNWLDITGRARMDNTNTLTEVKRAAGTDGLFASLYGFYTTSKSVSKSTYLDLIASVHQTITPFLKFNSLIGGSYQGDKIDVLGAGGNLLRLANFYSVAENTSNPPTQLYSNQQLQSAFASTEFEFKGGLFLNFTGRYEWPSQLPKGFAAKTSYFYPSAGVSAVLTDALPTLKNVMSFAKLRMSYAEVGNPPGFGMTNPTYSLNNPDAFRPAPFPDYLPERTKSYEVGMELKFLKNKLSLNATVYKSNTTNQLLDQKVTTGGLYTDFYYNAGNIENKGIEASLGYSNKFGDFSLATNAVFTLNRNKIRRLSEGFVNPVTKEVYGADSIRNGTVGNDLLNILAVNGTMADLYLTQLLREDNQGHLWVDPGSGGIGKMNIPARYIGYTTPDYTIGWRNNVSYKNFDLSFLIDARVGGIGISYTQSIMDFFGVSRKSADDRDSGGVAIYGKKFQDVQAFYSMVGGASGGSVGMAAHYVYNATNVRLREAALGYTLTGSFLKGKINNIRIALTGRNLLMFYNRSPFDPESTSSTGTYYQGIDYFRQPSYRSIGFSVRAQF